jgi:hypothetical protein
MLAMYRPGSNDKTWMYPLLPPYPSPTARGRWDESGVVGFTPRYYGPHVPWTYSTPYLYGADLGEAGSNRNLLIAGGLVAAAGVLYFATRKSSRRAF